MNDYARRMMRDGRNPYGSRGGYVTSRSPRGRRDRGEYDEPYMDSGYNDYGRSDGHYRRGHDEYPYEEVRGNFEYSRQPYDDYGDMRDYRMRGRDYGDDYGYDDYGGRSRNARGQYTSRRTGRRDYGEEEEMELSKRDMKEWERMLENEDGSRGAHWDKQQVEEVAKRIGINPDEFGSGTLWIMTNVMYSDYCGVARELNVDRPDFYVKMAKAFLKDKDFDGEPAEKAMLYYKCLVAD